jgi:hypothetical protein
MRWLNKRDLWVMPYLVCAVPPGHAASCGGLAVIASACSAAESIVLHAVLKTHSLVTLIAAADLLALAPARIASC